MTGNIVIRIAGRCGAGILLSAISGASLAQRPSLQFDEIIVTATTSAEDPTLIAPDAASLLATPGDVNDPLKALLSLPGVTFGGGDLDEPVIRGGGPNDNLFLIDGAPVENLFHELSDSIVSPNVLRTFDLHAAAVAPAYGGAVGGVIDISLRDPSETNRRANVDLSQLKSGLLLETPITDNVSAYGAYRHNLAHFFLEEFERGNDALVFQMPKSRDYAGRVMWRGADADIALTAFGSWDLTEEVARDASLSGILGEAETRRLDAQSLRIRAALSDATRLTATLSHSRVNEDRRENNGSFAERNATVIAFRGAMEQSVGAHQIVAGVNHTHTDNELGFRGFLPLGGRFEQRCGAAFSAAPATLSETLQKTELYAGVGFVVTERFIVDLGLHGAIDYFLNETLIEPRIGASYDIHDTLSVYARFGRHHAAPDARTLLILNTLAEQQESERSTQALIGQRWNVSGGWAEGWRLQTEAWYKDFKQTELIGTPAARKITGEAYGLDILIAKPVSERLYGWMALSLSEGTFTDDATQLTVNNRFAPPVSATVAASYAFDGGWKIGAKYRAQSGDAFTPLVSVTADPVTGAPTPVFGTPFSERLRAYHRLDIRLEKRARYSFGDVVYYADILNVTDRENVANRDFPLRNAIPDGANAPTILPDDEEGIPFFVAFGINVSF